MELEIAKLVSQMRVDHRAILRRDPIPDIAAEEEQRQEKQHHPRKKSGQILHLAPDNNSPAGIGRMVHQQPKEATDQNGEEIEEGK